VEEKSKITPNSPEPDKKVQISFVREIGKLSPDSLDDETSQVVPPELADLNAVFDEYEFIRTIG